MDNKAEYIYNTLMLLRSNLNQALDADEFCDVVAEVNDVIDGMYDLAEYVEVHL